VFEFGNIGQGAAVWIGDQTIGFTAGENDAINGATVIFDNGAPWPTGLELDIVVAVRPGDGQIRMWLNGKEFDNLLQEFSRTQTFGSLGTWAADANGSFALGPAGNTNTNVPSASRIAPSGFDVIEPLSAYAKQLPQHFLNNAPIGTDWIDDDHADSDLALYFKTDNFRVGNGFVNDVAIDDILSITRTSVGSYESLNGIITEFAAGEFRIGDRGVLIERTGFNRILQSRDFGTTWTIGNGTVDTNATLAPIGTVTADRLVADSAGGTGEVSASQPITIIINQDTCFSVIAKKDTLNWLAIRSSGYDVGVNGTSWFDLDTGVVGTKDANHIKSGVRELGSTGWFLCYISFDTTTDLIGEVEFLVADADSSVAVDRDGVSSIFLSDAQSERYGGPTSRIPTTTGAVTRQGDVIRFTDLTWIGAEGTFYFAATASEDFFGNGHSLMFGDDNNQRWGYTNAADGRWLALAGGATSFGTVADGDDFRLAVAWGAPDGTAASLDGAAVTTDATVDHTQSIIQLSLGSSFPGANQLDNYFDKFVAWTPRLADSRLVTLAGG
jgi:hypothetical protein